MKEVQYGLRDDKGRYARIEHVYSEPEDDEGSDFYFLENPERYPDLPIYETPNMGYLALVMNGEVSEWGSSADCPSTRSYRQTLDGLYPVEITLNHEFDILGGEPVSTHRQVERIVMPTLVKGHKVYDEKYLKGVSPLVFEGAYADLGDNDEALGNVSIVCFSAQEKPEIGMFLTNGFDAPAQVLAVEPMQDHLYALLVINDPKFFVHKGVVPMVEAPEEEASGPKFR